MPKPKTNETKPAAAATGVPRQTKQDILLGLLSRPEGATIAEIAAATGWQHHSVRGVMSGVLKKRLGLEVTSEKSEHRGRVYKLSAVSRVDA